MRDGCIIRMTDKDYMEKFLSEVNEERFTRVVISQRIRINKTYPNTLVLGKLYPPSYCTSMVIKKDVPTDEYIEAYTNYLHRPENMTLLTILVSSVIKTGGRLVLLCTKDELDFAHLEIICDLIEELFDLKCYTLKKFNKLKEIHIPNKAIVMERLNEALEFLNKIELEKKYEEEQIRKKVRKDLEDQEWDYLYNFCKRRNIKAKKKYSKSKLIDNIMDADKAKNIIDDSPPDDDEDDAPYRPWANI